ncbi:hypothetical protein NJL88_12965 [Streptomyces sp. DK15]|uniref:hypothetical protein n=1 Tax=Streptomyces sp. DK15 TaxID=2957499 RepID=UPI0029B17FA5|nr:hypothetical protein [Streptomyces sp. DK15]MDX2390956.1 hypothetical protein [Streptomyces sp. DK15]
MDVEDRFLGAEWLLRKAMAADGTEGDVDPDLSTVDQFMNRITEACEQASIDTRLATVAKDLFAENEDG